jgi:S1-C subfamily serine protease
MHERLTFPFAFLAIIFAAASVGAESLAEVFERVDPTVVEIATTETALPNRTGTTTPTSVRGLGSGFLISADGLIMTAAHVVQAADEMAVRFVDGTVTRARVEASDPAADVALIRAQSVPEGNPVADLGDSDAVRVGDEVFVVGAPMGIAHTLTVGHVSGRRTMSKLYGDLESAELLQTDAAINTGNSGGPMFNLDGEVIGIVSHIISSSGGSQGLGFVVTIELARRLLLEEPTPWTGLDGYLLQGQLAAALNVPGGVGILVQRVASGSPAARLDLRPGSIGATIGGEQLTLGGDVILSVQGTSLAAEGAAATIREALRSLGPEDRLTVQVLRDGQVLDLTTVGASP